MREPRFPLLNRVWPLLLAILIVVFLIGLRRSMFVSFDTYFHLRFGEEFLTDWSPTDPGQVGPSGSAEWLPTQWLSQVAMAWTADHLGLTLLGVIFLVLTTMVPAGVYILARSRAGLRVSIVITALATAALPNWLSLRPQLISFLLCIVLVALWQRSLRTGGVPWLLIPLGWFWAMAHGLWIIGVLVSVLAAIGVCLESRPERRRCVQLMAIPVGMFLAALVTPAGPGLIKAVVSVGSRGSHFAEWAAPSYTSPYLWPTALLIGAAFLLAAHGRGLGAFDLIMLATSGGLALYSSRTVPVALIVCAPIAAELASRTLTAARPRIGQREVLFLMAGIAIVSLTGWLNGSVTAPGDTATDIKPFKARLADLPAGTPLLTDRPIGSTLMWTDPGLAVLVHGYGDVYTAAELSALDDMTNVEPGWDDTVRDLGATVALLPNDSALAYALEGQGWQSVETHRDIVWLAAPTLSD